MKDYTKAFNTILNKLKNNENFAFTRFSDGELFILQNKKLVLAESHYITGDITGANKYTEEEQKEFNPEKDGALRSRLIESFKHNQDNYFKGICTSADAHVGKENFEWMVNFLGGDHPNLTYANLLINANYKRFVKELIPIFSKREIIYVVNKLANVDNLPFSINKIFPIGSNCMINDYDKVDEIKEYINTNDIKDAIVLCSAASLSNAVIYECFKENNNNTFLDIGSCLNPLLGLEGWKYTRGYLTSYWLGHNNHYSSQRDTWG